MTIVLKKITSNLSGKKTSRISQFLLTVGFLILISAVLFPLYAETGQNEKVLFTAAQSSFEAGLKAKGKQRRVLMIKAAGQFRSLIEDHEIENGYLYFNMGNAYFEADEIGRAILSYRRAEKLLPGSVDLQYNLAQARSRLNLTAPESSWGEKVLEGLVFWHTMINYDLRRNLFVASFILVWVILAVMIFRRHIFLRMGLILMIVTTLGFGGSYLFSYYQLNMVPAGVITVDGSIARKGPGLGYDSFYEKPLPGGTEFVVREKRKEWMKIRLSVGDEVWIKEAEAGLI